MVGLVEEPAVEAESIASETAPAIHQQTVPRTLTCRDLFVAFFKAGLAFGGGPGILAALDRELVERRRAVSREDLMTTYALGRVIPSGTMTAVAVAYGHRYAGFPGTVAALTGLVLPGASLTVLLTMGYATLRESAVLPLLAAAVLPAALAFIVAAALRFGRMIFRPSLDLWMAVGSLVGAAFFGMHPFAILVAAGLMGMVAFRAETKS